MKDNAVVFGQYNNGEKPAEYYVESDAFLFKVKALNLSHALKVAQAAFPFLHIVEGQGQHHVTRPVSGTVIITIEK